VKGILPTLALSVIRLRRFGDFGTRAWRPAPHGLLMPAPC